MKKTVIIIFVVMLSIVTYSQHFVPLKLSITPDELNMAFYGGLSLDKGSGEKFSSSISNTTQTGFIVNALYKKRGKSERFHQFLIDFNPIIVGWDPFSWNKIIKQPVDSFSVNKLPFSEDALLHIGWQINSLSRIFGTRNKNEYQLFRVFGDMYYRPYNIEKNNLAYRFSTFNVSLGTQYSYVKKEVPVIGGFLIGFSLQFNLLLNNEVDAYQQSFKEVMGEKYSGKNFIGPGAKIIVQTNYLNIYVEGRQYYAIDARFEGQKLTSEPIILVGAFANLQWTSKKNKKEVNNGNIH